jgi:hypothetical protein
MKSQMEEPDEHYVAMKLSENRDSEVSQESEEEEETFFDRAFSERKQLGVKFFIYVCTLSFLFVGRFTVPDNEPQCIVDNVQNWLLEVNYFILHNTSWRNAMQIICSVYMDIVYLSSAGYWVLYWRSGRLILSMIFFYGVRALVQQIWESPFPAGFWWYDPGFPSLVVPYGRGSDFFYSGHMGFLVICACEWAKNGHILVTCLICIGACYTCFILLAYQVHYSIDIFTGVFFAHWSWMMYDKYSQQIDGFFIKRYISVYCRLVGEKPPKSVASLIQPRKDSITKVSL